jgi:hypothetical protein
MKTYLIPYLVSFAAFSSAQQGPPTFGGNLPAMRPTYTAQDESNFNLALSYLQPGDMARIPAVEWEVLWDPKGQYNFRGIDAAIKKLAAKDVKQLWVLQPCPYPASPWYKGGWSDWWLPKRDLWPDIVKMNTKIVRHIIDETKKYTSVKPLFQVWNEPEGGKPGGSTTTQFGEWKPEFHELLYKLVKDLRAQKIPKELLVGPAVSSFGESRRSETAEFLSMMPPKDLDWLSECGYRACHLRLSAPGAGGDPAKVKAGFQKSLDWYRWIDSKFTWPAGQKVILSELYVTPGDVGVKIDANMSQFHSIAFDLIDDQPFAYVLPWGLRPGEQDAPDNAYLRYGGFGDSMRKWRTKRGG